MIGLQLHQKLPLPKTLTNPLTWSGTDRRKDKRTEERTNGWTDEQMDRQKNEWMDAQNRKHNAPKWGIINGTLKWVLIDPTNYPRLCNKEYRLLVCITNTFTFIPCVLYMTTNIFLVFFQVQNWTKKFPIEVKSKDFFCSNLDCFLCVIILIFLICHVLFK